MKWIAKPTGDMTLSILDENGLQVLKVDMLKYNTLKAEMDAIPLFTALNDLQVIANFTEGIYDVPPQNGKYNSGDEHSPLPWSYEFDSKKRKITVRNANKKKICDKDYPRTVDDSVVSEILAVLDEGIENINRQI